MLDGTYTLFSCTDSSYPAILSSLCIKGVRLFLIAKPLKYSVDTWSLQNCNILAVSVLIFKLNCNILYWRHCLCNLAKI